MDTQSMKNPGGVHSLRQRLVQRLEQQRGEMVEFLQALLRRRTPNPPGDTRPAMELVRAFLSERGLSFEEVTAEATMPNVVAGFDGARDGPHLVMNGHIDVFPVGEAEKWEHDPWAATIVGSRIVGRGACDMKSGTTALLFAFAALSEMRGDFSGRLTLTVVSDEETFGPYGSRHVLATCSDVRGDCMLSTEPTSPMALRYGEKGPLWLRFEVETRGAHSAYAHLSPNSIQIAAEIIHDLNVLCDMETEGTRALVRELDRHGAAIDAAYGKGASSIIAKVTINPALLRGGVKINMIPSHCSFDVDIRVPPGLDNATVLRKVDTLMKARPGVRYSVLHHDAPNLSSVDHPMIGILQANAKEVSGVEPAPIIGLGATDARLWRQAGVPAFVYGPSPRNMGTANEYVEIDEFMHIAKVHALSAFDFLSGPL
jgi:succinyl-diaminopimelate desuccinylase